jgi:S1-C subfamily serine protease
VGLEEGAGAEAAGIKPFELTDDNRIVAWGDVIVAVDGKAVRSQEDVKRLLRGRKRGETVSVKVVRGDPEHAEIHDIPVVVK